MKQIDPSISERAKTWSSGAFDQETREKVKDLLDHHPEELTDAFYKDLEFGTGGLRGVMGVGTNRMNKYTVGMATQGLANYVLRSFDGSDQPRIAIAHDCRNNSRYFTDITAEVLTANGIHVYLFDALRPTPLLSFAVRELKCQAGIVITASHNPPEYNGYKAYWDDGGQLVPPHDKNIIAEVQKIDVEQIRFGKAEEYITTLDASFDDVYIERLKTLSLAPDIISKHSDLRMVFTPIHGSSVRLVPEALKAFGFEAVFGVAEQNVVDGNFPTVRSPNPEEPDAFEMALKRAREVDAEIAMASDPDGDRVGVAIKNPAGEFILLNGNQCAALLTHYVLEQHHQQNKLQGKEYIVKTIVTSELLNDIASHYNVECFDVFTGFKYIAEKMRLLEGEKQFLCGGEESYGFLVGDFVRDKDAVITCCMIAEVAAWARENGLTLYELLVEISLKYSLYVETLTSITRKGREGAEEIEAMMERFRKHPPASLAGRSVARIIDYQASFERDLFLDEVHPVNLPVSNVLQFILEDGTKVTMRPSGTEPKIKFYFSCRTKLENAAEYDEKRNKLLSDIEVIKDELQI